jgi:hypothetical protein
MFEMHPDRIHEEIELLGIDYSTKFFELLGVVPRWDEYYQSHDQTPHYEYLRKVLQALQWLRGPDRWVLKSPQHMEQFGPLKKVFPDATFIIPHRDPISSIVSLATMNIYSARMSRDPVRPVELGQRFADQVETMLRACVRDRDELPEAQTLDVLFQEFMADDISMVERIYEVADHPMTPEVRDAMRNFMKSHQRGKYGRVAFDLGAVGLDRDDLRERTRSYSDRFGVELEY